MAAELIFPFGSKHPLPTPADAELLTRRYRDLRGGLEMAPFWAWLAVSYAATALDGRPYHLLTQSLGVVAFGSVPFVRRYLNRRFGVVRQPWNVWGLVLVVGVFVFQWSMVWLGVLRDLSAPTLGLACAYVTWRDFRLRRHWLVPTVVCAVLSLRLPVITPDDPHSEIVLSARIALIAAAFCVAHLLDHRALVKLFAKPDGK